MIRRPPRSTRTDTLFPYTTLFRSAPVPDARLDGHPWRDLPVSRLLGPADAGIRLQPADPDGHQRRRVSGVQGPRALTTGRSEEHTSELQSLMRISNAVFCMKKKNTQHSTSIQSTNYSLQKQQ